MQYIVELEYIACVIFVVLLGSFRRESVANTVQDKLFRASVIISIFAVVSDIFSVYAIWYADIIPLSVNYWINSIYFIFSILMETSIFLCIVLMLYNERRTGRFYRVVAWMLLAMTLQLILVALNPGNGLLFTFNEERVYARGPLNGMSFYCFLADIVVVGTACVLERKHIREAFRRVIGAVVPLTLMMGAIQYGFPKALMTGCIAAVTMLVLFIYGQQRRAYADSLTNLSNRENFYRILERLYKQRATFRVIIISLRDFKLINNRFGQQGGDQLLKEVGEYLHSVNRHGEACRFSGVEFALVLPDIQEQEYEELFQKICLRFHEPWALNGEAVPLRAAIADIGYPEHASNINDIVSCLEYAVRLSKESESCAPVRVDKQLKSKVGRRNYVISQMEPAFQAGRYYLNFQPVYSWREGKFIGAEALMRMRDATGAVISPGEFIPLAEETGLISKLGAMAVRKTCEFLSAHRDLDIQWISVNASAQQYQYGDPAGRVLHILEEYGLDPHRLKIEITERVLVSDVERGRTIIEKLRENGVGVCLDDFGTGYSNISNVMLLPFDCVKIDKSFIDYVAKDRASFRLLETVVKSLSELNVQLLAEGVETEEQSRIVQDMGIQLIQGFYYAKPMEGEAFAECMREQAAGASWKIFTT